MEKPWREDVEELDSHLSKVIMNVTGSFLPAYAIAAALIDAGVLKRARLLEIITAVHDLAMANAVVGEAEEEVDVLERFLIWLEEVPIEEGTALDQLRLFAASRTLLDLQARKRRSRDE